jgi:hypothetical protein
VRYLRVFAPDKGGDRTILIVGILMLSTQHLLVELLFQS